MFDRDAFVFIMFAAVPFCLPFLLSYTMLSAKGLWTSLLFVAFAGAILIAFTEGGLSQGIAMLVVGVFFLPGGLLGVIAGLLRRHLGKKNKWLPWKLVGAFVLSALICALLSARTPIRHSGQPPIYIHGYLGMYTMLVLTTAAFGSLISATAHALQRRKTPPSTEE